MSGADSPIPGDVPSIGGNGGGIDIEAISEASVPEFAGLGPDGALPDWIHEVTRDYIRDCEVRDGEMTVNLSELADRIGSHPRDEKSSADPRSAVSTVIDIARIMYLARHEYGESIGVNIVDDSCGKRIEDIRSSDVGSVVSIDCRVTDRADVSPTTRVAQFDCPVCGDRVEEVQGLGTEKLEVPRCRNEECGAKIPASMLNERVTTYVDVQEVILQDRHAAASGANPSDMLGVMVGRGVMAADAGDDVTVTAVVKRAQEVGDKHASLYLQVVGVEHRDEDYSSVVVSDAEEERIKEVAKSGAVHSQLAASIAPSIKGDYSLARRAGLYMLAGGPASMTRSQAHVLYVGDPSVGKSKLAKAINDVSPTSQYASGDSSSAVGLTASVQREDRFNVAEWTVSGGVVVRADGGHAVIDELDKASAAEQKSLHEALSEQSVTVNKGPIRDATLKARCSVLMVANPTSDRFRPDEPMSAQFDVNDALRSRMDVVVPFQDVPGDGDAELAREIMDDVGSETDGFSVDFLRKFIAFARRNYADPSFSDAAKDLIAEWWADLRQESRGSTAISVDHRKREAAMRIAGASAKLRLSDTITEEDAERATALMDEWMDILLRDENGSLDVDRVSSSTTASERDRQMAFNAAMDVHAGGDGRVHRDVLVSHMVEEEGLDKQAAQQEINRIAGAGKDAEYDSKDSSYIVDLR